MTAEKQGSQIPHTANFKYETSSLDIYNEPKNKKNEKEVKTKDQIEDTLISIQEDVILENPSWKGWLKRTFSPYKFR